MRRPLRILFVEDEAVLRRSIIRSLGCFDWIEAASYAEALERLSPSPDRLLIDVQLGPRGNTDGLKLLSAIRGRGLEMPAIVLSAYLDFGRALCARRQSALAISKDGLCIDGLREVLEDPFANASAREELSLDDIARQIRQLAGPLAKTLRDLREVAMQQELDDNEGNVSATSRRTGYTRTHVGRFKGR